MAAGDDADRIRVQCHCDNEISWVLMLSSPDLRVESLVPLLGRAIDDPALSALLGPALANVARGEDSGWLAFEAAGVGVGFKEARWLVYGDAHETPDKLIVQAVFLYDGNRESFKRYTEALPDGLAFSEPATSVLQRLGPPEWSGGGSHSWLFGGVVPHWTKYERPDHFLHLQFSQAMLVELVTLIAKGFR